MNYREAHKTCDTAYAHARGLRWLICLLLALGAVVAVVIGISERDMKAAIGVPVQCLLIGIAWWIICTAAMAVAAGMHACVSTARAQVDDIVDADSNCADLHAKRLAKAKQPAATTQPPMQTRPPTQAQPPSQPDRPLGQLPGESLEAWAKRTEQAELAAFKARSKA